MVVPQNALDLQSGAELLLFPHRTVEIGHITYTILTGYEGTGKCFWCGGTLKGKLKRYCRGHMQLYYRHFMWSSASGWALDRAEHRCQNCGVAEVYNDQYGRTNLNVHHIVPLDGRPRDFSAFNLPWNLCSLCIACHLEIHTILRGVAAVERAVRKQEDLDPWNPLNRGPQALMDMGL